MEKVIEILAQVDWAQIGKEILPGLVPVIMLILNYAQDVFLPNSKLPRWVKWAVSALIGYILGQLGDIPTTGAATGFASSFAYTEGRLRAAKG